MALSVAHNTTDVTPVLDMAFLRVIPAYTLVILQLRPIVNRSMFASETIKDTMVYNAQYETH